MEIILGLTVLFWIAPMVASAAVMSGKGRSAFGGFLLGAFLSWLGFAICLCLDKGRE